MATQLFKETMLELMDDYIEYAKELNESAKEMAKPDSLKLSFKDYSDLYMDFFSISNQEPLDDDLDYDDEDLTDEELRQLTVSKKEVDDGEFVSLEESKTELEDTY